MVKPTKHRDKILEALRKWFRVHAEAPTLEELCQELGMEPSRKGTLHKWLKTIRGIDVEWDDNCTRSIRLLREEPPEAEIQISTIETLRYVTTGLVDWEKEQPERRGKIPEALRIGMSQMYLQSLLEGDKSEPQNLPDFFDWAKNPLVEWKPTSEIQPLSPNITLIDDGLTSDFTRQWQVEGSDVTKQVQEKVLEDVLNHCRGHGLEKEYRAFRKQIINKPVLKFAEYRRMLSSSELGRLQKFLTKSYIDLNKFEEQDVYHLCPHCGYVQRKRPNGTYNCRNSFCDRLAIEKKLPPLPTIPHEQAKDYKIVTPGIHQYGTIPGIWELYLEEELSKLGVRVTIWPEIDEYDLLVEFDKKKRWAIDVKDWEHMYQSIKEVNYRLDATETFVVFPDEREETLRINVVRQQIEKELGGVRLKLISEIILEAKKILGK
ncbi:MAG: Fis family transcriptional regulator [Mastigocoleus sp. MO_167.B18]|nr:Fis family transcriptional regulator [Mastigocoleus sp. MO_167.B18]